MCLVIRKGELEMKTCDICDAPLGMFKKFRYAEGYICKACYEKASNHFTETIAKKVMVRSENCVKSRAGSQKILRLQGG